MDISYGYCHCGCGGKAPLAPTTNRNRGWVKGEPLRYIHNHHCRGGNNNKWKGGKKSGGGSGGEYYLVKCPEDLKSNKNGYRYEHVVVAERVLGKPLPSGAVVHHVNGDTKDNRPENLVICQDGSYHSLLHARARIIRNGGNPNHRRCRYCHKYDSLENLKTYFCKGRATHYHNECNTVYHRERKRMLRNGGR